MEPMDQKKKMIVVAVGVAMAILLGVLIYFIVAEDEEPKTGLEIDIPKVDEKKIDTISKLDSYDMIPEDSIVKDKSLDLRMYDNDSDNLELEELEMLGNDKNAYSSISTSTGRSRSNQIDPEVKALMEIQNQMNSQARKKTYSQPSYSGGGYSSGSNFGGKSAGGGSSSTYTQLIDAMKSIGGGGSNKSASQLTNELSQFTEDALEGNKDERIKKDNKKNYFYGISDQDELENTFVPAETVERSVLLHQAVIPIRIKRSIRYKGFNIPENSILYGVISFRNNNRLDFVVNSYKVNNKLYKVSFKIYDYDGLEGLSLNNRTWAKIPKQVTEDVFKYAYQKGTQASTFGTDNKINKEELKTIASLSAANEVAKEIFEKRRILMPEKYQIWIVLNND